VPKVRQEQGGHEGKGVRYLDPFTWQDYYDNVKYLSLGMVNLGLKRGDKVAMIGDNRPEGLWAEMAALCAGGTAVWLFQDCMMDEVKYIIDHSDAKFFVGETQEEVDKALSIKDACPKLEKVVWDDPKGMRNYRQDFLISIRVRSSGLGRELDGKGTRPFREDHRGRARRRHLPPFLHLGDHFPCPKGALLSHWNMLTMGRKTSWPWTPAATRTTLSATCPSPGSGSR
jgi:long-chain acyl-CoA synthetase